MFALVGCFVKDKIGRKSGNKINIQEPIKWQQILKEDKESKICLGKRIHIH